KPLLVKLSLLTFDDTALFVIISLFLTSVSPSNFFRTISYFLSYYFFYNNSLSYFFLSFSSYNFIRESNFSILKTTYILNFIFIKLQYHFQHLILKIQFYFTLSPLTTKTNVCILKL